MSRTDRLAVIAAVSTIVGLQLATLVTLHDCAVMFHNFMAMLVQR